MSGIGNFLRNYEFLNLTKSLTESQMALYKEPNNTWSEVGSNLCKICLYNGLSITAVGADVATYLAVSTLRSMGLFCALPPQPPVFPSPHDNVQFLDCAIKRALWDWDPALRKEIEEGIESSLSEKWNVFQVVGEWSFAYSLENGEKSNYYKPTFLTISESLENGATFRNICTDFSKLWQNEKKAILNALYHQSQAPFLNYKAKTVYQNIRAIASKLHQGNQIYLTAFSEYVKQKDSAASSMPAPVQNLRPPPYVPVYPVLPSAPSLVERNVEMEMASHLAFLRRSLTGLPNHASRRIKAEILSDRTDPSDVRSPKSLLARLALLQAFESSADADRPEFLPWNRSLRNGKTFREAVQDFASLRRSDFVKLQGAVLDSWRSKNLSAPLEASLNDLNEFGQILAGSREFLKIYEALRTDLLVS